MKVRLAVLCLLAFAFWMRLGGLDSARHDVDRGYPHGLGIRIAEQAGAGEFAQLPLFTLSSAVGLPNLAASSYLWAVVSIFDRSAFVASAVSAMLNVLAVAMVFDLGRRMFGYGAGFVAAALAAASVWGGFFSRGAWLQGQLEFFAVTSAWLVWTGILRRSSRRIIAGMAFTAVAMQTYAVALGLFAQVGISTLIGALSDRRIARPLLLGFGVCLASLALYAGLVLTRSDAIATILRDGLRTRVPGVQPRPAMQVLGVRFDPDGWRHALRIASGRDFESVFTDANAADFAPRTALANARAIAVEVLIVTGILVTLASVQARKAVWLVLAWFAVPIVVTLIAATTSDTLNVAVFYLLLTAPAGYLLAGAPFAMLERWRPRASVPIATVVGVALCATSIPNWNAHLAQNYARAWDGNMIDLPLRWQMQLGRLWRASCSEVNNGENNLWLTSILEGTARLRHNAYAARQSAEVWQVAPTGSNCVTTPNPITLPVARDELVTQVNDFPLVTYRASSPEMSATLGNLLTTTLMTNIGWVLTDVQAPAAVKPGDNLTVQHTWRIDSLPAEPYGPWYFAPFVKLFAPDDAMIKMVDYAPGVIGVLWRMGDVVTSKIDMSVPSDLPDGDYRLELSLFDPNQQKNAVYFNPDAPDQPIVVLDLPLRVAR